MSEQHLHIVSFDVPWPANYGGVIDVFHRARTLTEMGVKVHLHCFEYGRREQEALNFCHEVHYYKRDTSLWRQFSRKPYIVASRHSEQLVKELLKDDYPVLCEGLHTAALLEEERLRGRAIYVRMHNVEHDYYRLLGQAERSWWKRLYFYSEARKLDRYEKILSRATGIFAVTEKDAASLSARYANVILMPSSCANDEVTALPGTGEYVLYHGNLSVRENEESAMWLLDNVFCRLKVPCIIAGLRPSEKLAKRVAALPNVTLRADLPDKEMRELIRQAQVNVLVTHQPTGLKLKLLNALYQGRHCVVNEEMVAGTPLGSLCTVADDGPSLASAIEHLWSIPFTKEELQRRQQAMSALYDTKANARLLIRTVFPYWNR